MHTRRGIDAFVVNICMEGIIPCAGLVQVTGADGKAQFRNDVAVTTERNVVVSEHKTERRVGLFTYLKRDYAELKWHNAQTLRAELRKWGCKDYRNQRDRGIEFPPIAELRKNVEKRFGPMEWPAEITDWGDTDEMTPAPATEVVVLDTEPKPSRFSGLT